VRQVSSLFFRGGSPRSLTILPIVKFSLLFIRSAGFRGGDFFIIAEVKVHGVKMEWGKRPLEAGLWITRMVMHEVCYWWMSRSFRATGRKEGRKEGRKSC
jgi:hypothetical protein